MKRKVVVRAGFDCDKEDRFMNDMSAKGFDLIRWWFPGIYLFESGEPGYWTYRNGVLPRADKAQYLALMADAGIETVVTFINGTATFRKRTADGPFEIYSDAESRIAFFRGWRKRYFFLIATTVALFVPQDFMASRELSHLELLPLLLLQLALMTFLTVQTMRLTRQIRALEAERLLVE
jgi:hypothetical protein